MVVNFPENENRAGKVYEINVGMTLGDLAFSPDGKFIAGGGHWSPSQQKIITKAFIWDSMTGDLIHEMTLKGMLSVTSIIFLNETRIIIGGYGFFEKDLEKYDSGYIESNSSPVPQGIISIWDVIRGRKTDEFFAHVGTVYCITVSRDRKLIAYCATSERFGPIFYEPAIIVYDTRIDKFNKITVSLEDIWNVDISPDNSQLISAGTYNNLSVWNLNSLSEVARIKVEGFLKRAIFIPDGVHVLTVEDKDDRSSINMWNILTGIKINRFRGEYDGINRICVSPNGKYAISGGGDKMLRIWDVHEGIQIGRLIGHKASIEGIALSPNGKFAISSSVDETLCLWRLPQTLESG